ncbi:MAG: proton-conducting transporter membrane subunit [bacterium]
MNLIPLLLITLPCVVGVLLLATSVDRARCWIVWLTTALLMIGVIALTGRYFAGGLVSFTVGAQALSWAMLLASVGMALFVLYVGLRAQRPLIMLLMLAQFAIMLPLELSYLRETHKLANLFADKLSLIMAAIIGVAGGLICACAAGYMREFHKQRPEIRDRQRVFLSVIYVFLGAMFGVIFSNNLLWMYFFWEITTLAVYLLISYKLDELSNRNALRALTMNLAGGIGLAVGIWVFQQHAHSLMLADLLNPDLSKYALIPAAAFCFAGLTKSAQYPFTRWLLGATEAPAPVAALLQSSAMVTTGVYLIIRMAPVMHGTATGVIVAILGAVAFLTGSTTAVLQSDTKKALAYSTIATLGLIVLCGGIGTIPAVFLAILMAVVHAVAKGLSPFYAGYIPKQCAGLLGTACGCIGRYLPEARLQRRGNLIAIVLLVGLFLLNLP